MSIPLVRSAAIIGLVLVLAACAPSAGETKATPTATATATPTPTPTLDPDGVAAFGGDCGAVLTLAEVTDFVGTPMRSLAPLWSPGSDHRLGGIECRWTTSETYAGAGLSVFVYPLTSAESVAGGPRTSGCEVAQWIDCVSSRKIGELWVWTSASLPAEATGGQSERVAEIAESITAIVAERAVRFPPAYAATRQPDWWQVASCAQAVEILTRAGVVPEGSRVDDRWGTREGPYALTEKLGLALGCTSVHVADGELVPTSFVLWPGGGAAVADAAAVDSSEPVTVPGSTAAVIAPSLDALEGHNLLLVAASGPNLIAVGVDLEGLSERNVALASSILAALDGN